MTVEEEPVFAEGQMMTVFRSRRRAGCEETYGPLADAMLAAARDQPGFVDFATFEAADGEKVSIVTFATPETHAAWRNHPAHRAAQQQGRDELYERYSIQVGVCRSVSEWVRPEG